MKGNVDPFEPWRPAEENVPPPVRAAQPWRPSPSPRQTAVEEPPCVEPVDPPRCRSTKRRRVRKAPPSAPAAPLRTDQRLVVGMLLLLGVLGLMGLVWLGGTHVPRVAVTLLAVAAGFTVGISVAHRRGWYTRLGWMAGGLAAAALAAWFVPTLNGVNLWSAYRQVDELHALPAGEVGEFLRTAPARQTMVEEFPTFAADVRAAEQDWLRRSVDEAIENADRQLEHNPHQALIDLQRLNDELARLEQFARVRKQLDAARQRALQANAKCRMQNAE